LIKLVALPWALLLDSVLGFRFDCEPTAVVLGLFKKPPTLNPGMDLVEFERVLFIPRDTWDWRVDGWGGKSGLSTVELLVKEVEADTDGVANEAPAAATSETVEPPDAVPGLPCLC